MKRKSLIYAALVGALALLSLSPTSAIAGGKGGGNVSGASVPGSDDVGTGPRLSQGQTQSPGFVVIGGAAEIFEVLRSSAGSGTYEVGLAGNGEYAVVFKGVQRISIERAMLVAGKLRFEYVGSRRERARVSTRGSNVFLIQR